MTVQPGSFATFDGSMAEAIEIELGAMMPDGAPLNMDASDQSVRDRRRFLIAIARGVVRHLKDREASIQVFCEDNQTKPITINVDFT